MIVDFDATQIGFIPDPPAAKLPAGAWSDTRNVSFQDGAAEKAEGYIAALGSLSFTAIYLATISDGTNIFWLYANATTLYATDGTTHTSINSTSYTFAATDDLGWTGGPFHGYLIVNEGSRPPQSWLPSLSNKAQELTNWPANITAKVVRTFKDFIFALRITDTGTLNPRLMRWSDAAGPGNLPSSWDFADPTVRAGRKEFGETDDNLVDCLGLRDSLITYKEGSCYIARYVDLPDVFAFDTLFSEVGLLTENCVKGFKGNHFVITADDIVVHDGNTPQSIGDGGWRKWLFNKINTNRFRRCFVIPDYRQRKMWTCFPEAGFDWPNLALVWDWKEGTFEVRELGGTMAFGTPGLIPGASETFDASSGTFDSDSGTFDQETYSPFLKRVVFANAARPQALQQGDSELFLSATMTSYVTRAYLPISKNGREQQRVLSLAPRVHGDAGQSLNFYVGLRTAIDAAVTMQGPYPFIIGTDYRLDFIGQHLVGRFLDLKAEHHGVGTWRMFGVDMEVVPDGDR